MFIFMVEVERNSELENNHRSIGKTRIKSRDFSNLVNHRDDNFIADRRLGLHRLLRS